MNNFEKLERLGNAIDDFYATGYVMREAIKLALLKYPIH